jgi:hypothetical protein
MRHTPVGVAVMIMVSNVGEDMVQVDVLLLMLKDDLAKPLRGFHGFQAFDRGNGPAPGVISVHPHNGRTWTWTVILLE